MKKILANLIRHRIAPIALSVAAGMAQGADGITANSIRLGMSSPMTGTAGTYGLQMKQAIEAYVAQVNAAGGVHGRRIELLTMDDGYEPRTAASNARSLIEREKVFALLGFYGSSSTEAVLPIIESAGVPLVGTVSGAESLRGPGNHHLFHLRASYGDEAAAIVRNLTTVGIRRVAVFFQDDAFGRSGLDGIRRALAQQGLETQATGSVPRNSTQVEEAARAIAKSGAQAVVMVALAKPAAAFVREMHQRGAAPFFVALSPVGAEQLVADLGPSMARGIQVAQAIPNPWHDKVAAVRDYKQTLARFAPQAVPSYYGLEGYLDARLMVEALGRAGRNLTRESLTEALQGGEYDLGGYRLHFNRSGNTGSKYVEISVLGDGGRILD